MLIVLWTTLLLCLLSCTGAADIADTVIDSNLLLSPTFVDTAGNRVHAHGGGMLVQDGIYHWYGTTVKEGGAWLSEGINLYTSPDLKAWTNKGEVFHNTSIVAPMQGPYRIERPKVIFNKKTETYVMWFHLDTGSFKLRSVGVAQSKSATGPFRFVSCFQPDGDESLDMTLYQDDDGSAYHVRSDANKFAAVSKLTDDYLNTTGKVCVCVCVGMCADSCRADLQPSSFDGRQLHHKTKWQVLDAGIASHRLVSKRW